MWAYSSPELYRLLVISRGWSPERYGQFVGDSLVDALLGRDTGNGTDHDDPDLTGPGRQPRRE